MRTAITSENAEYNAQRLRESKEQFELLYGFQNSPDGNNGWIAPNGKLWAVSYTHHEVFCDLWLGKSESEVEKTHVKISAGCAYWYGNRLTSKQKATLFHYEYDSEKVDTCGVSRYSDYEPE